MPEHSLDSPIAETVWAEDVLTQPPRPSLPPRTEPPRHSTVMAQQLYERVAGGTRTRRRRRYRSAWRTALIGLGLLAIAAVVLYFRLDAGLVHVASFGLLVAGIVYLIMAAMKYDG